MYIPSKYNSFSPEPNWIQTLDGVTKKTGYELNCMCIGIVNEFFPDDLTADIVIANKKTLGLNEDGTQIVEPYPLIRAKVVYCNPFITFPINPGDECVLLFADREIESWFLNGDVNPEGYPRMHSKTDAVAIFGIRSLPNMISVLTNCLHLFYGSSDIQIKDSQIDINSALNIVGNTTQTGDITATNLNATAAATGTFTTSDNKTVTVKNGIITAIE